MIFRNIKHERRKEKRHYCNWPIWFAAGRNNRFFYGDIVDFSSDSLSLICRNNVEILQPGCQVKIYFGYSHSHRQKSSGVEIFSCVGNIYRIENLGKKLLHQTGRITLRLDKPLPFTPSRIKELNVIFEVLQKPETKEQLNTYSVSSNAGAD